MKIYTKTGDKGLTSLADGKRVPKNDARIEAYGNVDELIAFTGWLRDKDTTNAKVEELLEVQRRLMVITALLSGSDPGKFGDKLKLNEESVVALEKQIDRMNRYIEPLEKFVIPGGHELISVCHVARTVSRRAERSVITLAESYQVPGVIIRYLNRLSDYFFVLSRWFTTRLDIAEVPW
jgi:cob(I)alamin adenosyltransferase